MIDSTVIPSYLQTQEQGVDQDSGIQTSLSLRFGEVKEIIYPNDARNQNGRYIEYYVDVTGKDGFGARTTVRYYTCQLANTFGTPGDLVRFTLRPGDPGQNTIGIGAKVLVLCIDGEQARAIIISGVRDPTNESLTNKDENLGHNYFWEFNGVQQTVDKDGQLQFTFNGATDVDGDLLDGVDAGAQGSFLLMDKTGGIKLAGPDEDQSLYLDHAGQQYQVLVHDWNATVSGKLDFEITDEAKVVTQSGMVLQAVDNITMLSAGLRIGAATDATMLGTTFRTAQAQLHTQVKQAAAQASSYLNAASTALTAAAAGLTTPQSKAAMTAAAQLVGQAAQAMNAIASALGTFEGKSNTYLSLVNLSD